MARKMKVRTRTQDGMVEVLVLVNHPMETGLRRSEEHTSELQSHLYITYALFCFTHK